MPSPASRFRFLAPALLLGLLSLPGCFLFPGLDPFGVSNALAAGDIAPLVQLLSDAAFFQEAVNTALSEQSQVELAENGEVLVVNPDGSRSPLDLPADTRQRIRDLAARSQEAGRRAYAGIDEDGTLSVFSDPDTQVTESQLQQFSQAELDEQLARFVTFTEAKGGVGSLNDEELLSLLSLLSFRAEQDNPFASLLFARGYREFKNRQAVRSPQEAQQFAQAEQRLDQIVASNPAINVANNQIIAQEGATRRRAPRQTAVFDFASNQWLYGDDHPNSLLLNQSPYCDPTALPFPLNGFSYNGQLGIHNSATGTTTKFP